MLLMAYLLSEILPTCDPAARPQPDPAARCLDRALALSRSHCPVAAWGVSLGLVIQGLWRWPEALSQRRAAPEAALADAIVVFSGGRHLATGAARVSEWHDPDRFLAGLDLYRPASRPACFSPLAPAPSTPVTRPKARAI